MIVYNNPQVDRFMGVAERAQNVRQTSKSHFRQKIRESKHGKFPKREKNG